MQSFTVHGLPVEFESVSSTTLTNSVSLGETRVVGGEEYLYVYNAGAAQMSVGQFAVLSSNSGFSVTASSITAFDYPLGFVKHSTFPTAAYGWLLTRGFTQVSNGMASTALAVRDVIAPAVGGQVQVYFTATLVTGPMIGQVVSACASGASANSLALAYVRCFGT